MEGKGLAWTTGSALIGVLSIHGLEPEAADHSGQKPETDVLKRPLHAGSKPVFCTTGSAVDFRLHSRLVLMERYGVKDVQVRITAQYIVN
jgi:hypothetical protein